MASIAISKFHVLPKAFVYICVKGCSRDGQRKYCTSDVVQGLQLLPPLKAAAAGHSSMILNIKALELSAVPEDETGVIQ
jgi:hypothetical protein